MLLVNDELLRNMTIEITKYFKIIRPDEGKWLYNAEATSFSQELSAPLSDNTEEYWVEVTEDEKVEIESTLNLD